MARNRQNLQLERRSANVDFIPWNPQLRFDVVNNEGLTDLLTQRTLQFTLIDNARRYDQIEWEIDNTDGLLTRPEYAALGLLVRVRLGYAANSTAWKAFLVSRMKGGVGVWHKENPAVGDSESRLTLSGRNRNAPDLRSRKRRKRKRSGSSGRIDGTPRVTGTGTAGGGRRGAPTSDVVQYESVYRGDPLYETNGFPRVYDVRHVSDMAREVARGMGFPDSRIFVEQTPDQRTSVVIPEGMTAMDYLKQALEDLNWEAKVIQKNEFHFHSIHWGGQSKKSVKVFTYGGPDILQLQIDTDFRLPSPLKSKAVGWSPTIRTTNVSETTGSDSSFPSAHMLLQFLDDAALSLDGSANRLSRVKTLLKDETFAISGGELRLASEKDKKLFVERNLRAIKLSLRIVGNPHVSATDLITLKGTGTPLIDHIWYVDVAKHIFNGTTYETELSLILPPKQKKGGSVDIYTSLATEGGPGGDKSYLAQFKDDAGLAKLGRNRR